MLYKIYLLILLCVVYCDTFLYSSFWAPLFGRSRAQNRVDVPFSPRVGQPTQTFYYSKYGYRGEKLIAALGKGLHPPYNNQEQVHGDIKIVNIT